MGFIRKKKVKDYIYFCYCERKRSCLKEGGSGKVTSTHEKVLMSCKDKDNVGESLIFSHSSSQYISYWLWEGLSVQDYLDAYLQYKLSPNLIDRSKKSFFINWEFQEDEIVAGSLGLIDENLQTENILEIKKGLQEDINEAIEQQNEIETRIKSLTLYLIAMEQCKKYKKYITCNEYESWKDDNILQCLWPILIQSLFEDEILSINLIESLDELLLIFKIFYQKNMDELIQKAPKFKRKIFKCKVNKASKRFAFYNHSQFYSYPSDQILEIILQLLYE